MPIDSRNIRNTIFVLATLVLFAFLANNIRQFWIQQKQVTEEEQGISIESQKGTQSLPKRLTIQKLSIDAPIEHLGVATDGTMAIPEGIGNVGWYKFGPSPGFPGSAVISGHLDGSEGNPGVFSNLGELEQGDKIDVLNEQGITNTFVVRESRIYEAGYAEEVFLVKDSGIHLNLVTCDGVWDETTKNYSKRLVVFTDLID